MAEVESLRDEIKEDVQKILPHICPFKLEEVADFLIGLGVKKMLDLRRMTVDLLTQKVDLVDASDLHEEWQKKYGASNQPASVTQQSVLPLREATSAVLNHSMPSYTKDSPFIPAAVREAINANKRPSASAREDMVGRIVDDCREKVPNLTRSSFNVIARQLVHLYPQSFKDTLPISDHGSDGLMKQFQTKYDNDRRPKNVQTTLEKEAPQTMEAYGCIQWNPSLPQGATEEGLDNIRTNMLQMHKLASKHWEWKTIKQNMEESYYSQRKDINGTVSTKSKTRKRKRSNQEELATEDGMPPIEVKKRWPFLFTAKGMNYHFKILTGTDFRDKMLTFMREEAELLIEYLATRGEVEARVKRCIARAEKKGNGSAKVAGLIAMLIEHFKEDIDAFITFVEATTTFEDVENVATFPQDKKPVLVGAGKHIFKCEKFYFCAQNRALCSLSTLSEGVELLFSSYFVLNTLYSPNLSATLLFMQRVIASINPQGKLRKIENPELNRSCTKKVQKLHNKFVEYKQLTENEENDSS